MSNEYRVKLNQGKAIECDLVDGVLVPQKPIATLREYLESAEDDLGKPEWLKLKMGDEVVDVMVEGYCQKPDMSHIVTVEVPNVFVERDWQE